MWNDEWLEAAYEDRYENDVLTNGDYEDSDEYDDYQDEGFFGSGE